MIIAESAGAVTILTALYNVAAAYNVPHDVEQGNKHLDETFDMVLEWGPQYDEKDQETVVQKFHKCLSIHCRIPIRADAFYHPADSTKRGWISRPENISLNVSCHLLCATLGNSKPRPPN
jgi:hypothetical protein